MGLHVARRRNDGYHDIETIFYPIKINDALEFISSNEFAFNTTGLSIEGNSHENLCVKAFNLLKHDFPQIPQVNIHLHKAIPMGAGLGGGSADAAFMLMMLNKNYHLQLSSETLMEYALQVSSDSPFFIINKPCYATGRGENLEQVDADLAGYKIVVVNPGIHVSTKHAFAAMTPLQPAENVKQIIRQPVATWKDEMKNDFENTVFALYPAIKEIKAALYNAGAVYASMSGSGSSMFGIFEADKQISLSFPDSYYVKQVQ